MLSIERRKRVAGSFLAILLASCLLPPGAVAQSLLKNGDFCIVNSQGHESKIKGVPPAFLGDQSGAQAWTTKPWSEGTLETELMRSTFPGGDGGNMLKVWIDEGQGGIVNSFGYGVPEEKLKSEVTACAWVFLEDRGRVCLGVGPEGQAVDTCLNTPGRWQLLTVGNFRSPGFQVSIFGEPIFYVAYAAVYEGRPWEQETYCAPKELMAGCVSAGGPESE